MSDDLSLLALAYHRDGQFQSCLDTVDLDGDAVARAMAERGHAVSDLLPPAAAPAYRDFGPKVYFPVDDFGAVTKAVGTAYPPGAAFWGFNVDRNGDYFVHGEADLAIEAIVRSAVTDRSTVRVDHDLP